MRGACIQAKCCSTMDLSEEELSSAPLAKTDALSESATANWLARIAPALIAAPKPP
jgi:hypothetical protein